MRRICLSLAVVAFVVSTAQAQRQRPMGGRGFEMTSLMLLSNKSVQEELKINDEQKKKVEEVSKENRDEREKLMKDAGITRENFREKRDEMAKIGKTLNDKADKSLANVLTTDQSKRFKQI